jgi:GR25 family glycosyltransferase involved in LPS biosynthesis
MDCIEKILCIITEDEKDRKVAMLKHIQDLGISEKFKFMQFKRDKESGLRGCFNSHYKCFEYAYKKNLNNVLIIESDIRFYNHFKTEFNHIKQFITKNKNWDIIRLNFPVYQYISPSQESNKVWRGKGDTAGSYILSKKIIEKLVKYKKKFFNRKGSSGWFLSYFILGSNQYVISNPICYQDKKNFGSNIGKLQSLAPNKIIALRGLFEKAIGTFTYKNRKNKKISEVCGKIFTGVCYPKTHFNLCEDKI